MKKLTLIFSVLLSYVGYGQTVSVADVIAEIDQTNIERYVTTLQNFGTRFMLSPKRFEAANFIKGEFETMGFTDVELDSFQCHTTIGSPYFSRTIDTVTTQVNVIATLPGTTTPEQIYIICGHYDSFCSNADPFKTAPGADDNASGTSAVLESARAIMSTGFKPKSTLRFIAFAAEELMFFGDAGSEHYANAAKTRNDDIKLVINNDMIGYTEEILPRSQAVNIGYTDGYGEIDKVMKIANDYSRVKCNKGGYSGADLLTFFANGYPGIYFEEATFNNANYHRSSDIISNTNMQYLTEVIKAATAVLIGMDEPVTTVEEENAPTQFVLEQNYPNPFNPTTTIKFTLPSSSQGEGSGAKSVKLVVFDILGTEVTTLVNETKAPGIFEVVFDASGLSSGMYFYKLNCGNESISKKMLLVK